LGFVEESGVVAKVDDLVVGGHHGSPQFGDEQQPEGMFGVHGCATDGFAPAVDVFPRNW